MKRIIVFVVIALSTLILIACNKGNSKEPVTNSPVQDFIPPKISAQGEILKIDGHELTLKVIKSRTVYCEVGDILTGKLKNFDFQYNINPFKEGDIMNVESDIGSVTETEIKFDRIYP